jgi:hypothetical protein
MDERGGYLCKSRGTTCRPRAQTAGVIFEKTQIYLFTVVYIDVNTCMYIRMYIYMLTFSGGDPLLWVES